MPKKQTKTLVITLLMIDVISISIFMFLFFYTKSLIAESVNNSYIIKTELEKEDANIIMKDTIAMGKTYQNQLINYIVPSGGTVDFLTTLEQVASNSGVKFNINTVVNEPYGKGDSIGMELISIDMGATGEWKNIQFFLTSLENYPLKIDIKNVSMNKISDYTVNGKSVPQWSLSLEFTVVKMKDTK